jgi:hypothetical protein
MVLAVDFTACCVEIIFSDLANSVLLESSEFPGAWTLNTGEQLSPDGLGVSHTHISIHEILTCYTKIQIACTGVEKRFHKIQKYGCQGTAWTEY